MMNIDFVENLRSMNIYKYLQDTKIYQIKMNAFVKKINKQAVSIPALR